MRCKAHPAQLRTVPGFRTFGDFFVWLIVGPLAIGFALVFSGFRALARPPRRVFFIGAFCTGRIANPCPSHLVNGFKTPRSPPSVRSDNRWRGTPA